jgi:hypothetical protein
LSGALSGALSLEGRVNAELNRARRFFFGSTPEATPSRCSFGKGGQELSFGGIVPAVMKRNRALLVALGLLPALGMLVLAPSAWPQSGAGTNWAVFLGDAASSQY